MLSDSVSTFAVGQPALSKTDWKSPSLAIPSVEGPPKVQYLNRLRNDCFRISVILNRPSMRVTMLPSGSQVLIVLFIARFATFETVAT
ncbi:hypothetical protein V5F77_25130 [Xanthobacter sp. DSM 24535]|uniref:hypothetical protein n=1 Tax=Roseixanthobacter psychrophilus TaxID=3119917 RepID=UPI00372B2A19